MLAYASGVVVWQPERFPYLMASSCACVAAAAALFTVWAVRGAGGGPRLEMDVSLEAGSDDSGVR